MRIHERGAHRKTYTSVRNDYDQRRWNDVDNESWGLKSNHQSVAQEYYLRDPTDIFEPSFDRTSDSYVGDEVINRNFRESRGHTGKGPRYERPGRLILEDANEALFIHPDIDASQIIVAVEDGVVLLRGEVESREMKKNAEAAVEHVFGVTDVLNRLRVHGAGSGISETP